MNLTQYATTWQRDPENNFAVACYDMCSIAELVDALASPTADEVDCCTWQISSPEWYDAIFAALAQRRNVEARKSRALLFI